MKAIDIYTGHFEYFCNNCLQLRLCCDDSARSECGACGSKDIIKGAMGTLSKEHLIQQLEKEKFSHDTNRPN